jgi:thiamine-monophosphate kinase
MIDISDGLLADLGHICEESQVGAILELGQLPINDQMKEACSLLGLDPLRVALGPSDDYELLFTVPERLLKEAEEGLSGIGVDYAVIGKIVEQQGLWLKEGKGTKRVAPKGWDHFMGIESQR